MTLLSEYLAAYAKNRLTLSPATVANYGNTVSVLSAFLGHPARLSDLEEQTIIGWLRARVASVARRTARRERCTVLTLWRAAAQDGLVPLPPPIPVVPLLRTVPRAWLPEQCKAIHAAARTLAGDLRDTGISRAGWWESLVLTLYYTGCRIGAALATRWSDLDTRARELRLTANVAKTGTEQVVRLPQQAVDAIRAIRKPERQVIWPWPYTRRRLWLEYRGILTAAGCPTDRQSMFHRMRRTCYTQVTIAAGKDAAGRQLGHRTDMSRHYLDTTQLPHAEAADLMPPI